MIEWAEFEASGEYRMIRKAGNKFSKGSLKWISRKWRLFAISKREEKKVLHRGVYTAINSNATMFSFREMLIWKMV